MKGKETEKPKKGEKYVEDLSQMSRGMEMVTGMIDDYLDVRDDIRAKIDENRELRLAKQTEETADTEREHYGFPKEVMDLEDGKNLLGLVMKSFSEKAKKNIGKDEKVGKYWANEKVSKRWEMFGGIVGGVIGGGAGAALHAKMESYRLMEQIHSGQGVPLDLDGDKIEHTVRMMQNPASGQADYMWQMGSQDVARVGDESLSGWTHTFMSQNGFDTHIIQGGSFDAAALASLSPDQITVHATSLNIPEATLMQSLFMKALMTNALTVGSLVTSAIILDNLHYQVTGKTTDKNRKMAETVVGNYTEYSSQRRAANRQEKLDKQLTPRSSEEVKNEKDEAARLDAEAKALEAENKKKEDAEAEVAALKAKIAKFETDHGKGKSPGKGDFESIDRATLGWNSFQSPEGKVVMVEVERIGLTWAEFKRKVCDVMHSEMTPTNRVSLVLAIDNGEPGMLEMAALDPAFNPADRNFKNLVTADLDTAIQATPTGHPRGFTTGIDKINIVNRGFDATSPSPDLPSWKSYLEDVAKRDDIPGVSSKIVIHPSTIAP
jgi:hypothetical protein